MSPIPTRPLHLSVLDLGSPFHTVEIAPHVERLGYSRYWLSEHHGAGSFSASATVMTTLIAGLTEHIRVGPAGIPLPFHTPLKVAEDFRMLALLFPGRIDLGICRAGAAGRSIETALLDGRPATPFPARVSELHGLLTARLPSEHPYTGVPVRPPVAPGGLPEFWLLGASAASVTLAAELGVGFCFSEHLASMDASFDLATGPAAARAYRAAFRPSPELGQPRFSVCVAGVCADTEAAARRLLPSDLGPFRPTLYGSPEQCHDQLEALAQRYAMDEVVFADVSFELEAKLRSFELLAKACGPLAGRNVSSGVSQ